MTDHDHTPRSDPHDHDRAADERIDALARAAGSELRRPAPADGIARVQRTSRQRQATRIGAAGVAAVAILAVGAIVIGGRDGDETLVPATVTTVETDDTVDSTVPESTVPTEAVPATTPGSTPATESPTPNSSSTMPPNAAGDPEVMYASQEFAAMFGSEVSTVDPRTGEVLSTFVVDDAAVEDSRAAQDALIGTTSLRRESVDGPPSISYQMRIGEVVYRHATLPSEIPTIGDQDPTDLPFYDRCQQAEVIVEGAVATAVPERARSITASPDGRWLAVVAGVCPAPGTLADQVTSPAGGVDGFTVSVQVFDATRPDLPGRTLIDGIVPADLTLLSFSADGRFLAVESFRAPSLRVFDLDAGTELNPPASGDDECTVQGTRWSRFVGPWVGGTSLALLATCPEETRLVLHDVARGVIETRVIPGGPAEAFQFSADVDRAHFDLPETAWFTVCRADTTTCWIGQGAGPLVELPGVAQTSFLPLGFNAGG